MINRTIYNNARIITGTGEVIENGAVVIEHIQKDFEPPMNDEKPIKIVPSVSDKIIYVGSVEEYNEEAEEVVDVTGHTIMPGLIDCFTRLDLLNEKANDYIDNIGIAYRTYISYRNAAEALNSGVTTLRAEGMPNNIDIALKDAMAKTLLFGPSILATGPVYAVTAGKGREKYGLIEESGVDPLRAQMRIHISRGLEGVTLQVSGDRLKSLNGEYQKQMSTAEIKALTQHAKGAEKPVSANASGYQSIKACIESGVDCIQQGYRISEIHLKEMAERNISYIPCLVSTVDTEIAKEHIQTVKSAIKAGVKVVVGTDILPSEVINGTTAIIREMELLVEAGLTPAQAVEAATNEAAKVIKSKMGIIKVGGKADFLIIDGKPDRDITAMRKIAAVIKDGRRAFCTIAGTKERQFHIHAPLYEISGGTSTDWTAGAVSGVKQPENYNHIWNLIKEI